MHWDGLKAAGILVVANTEDKSMGIGSLLVAATQRLEALPEESFRNTGGRIYQGDPYIAYPGCLS